MNSQPDDGFFELILEYNRQQEIAAGLVSGFETSEEEGPAELTHVMEGPGSGIALSGEKAEYVRSPNVCFYSDCREHHDPSTFQRWCGHTTAEFDAIFEQCGPFLEQYMDPRLRHEIEGGGPRGSRVDKRVLSTREQMFLLLVMFRGGNEGSRGVATISTLFGVSIGTVSNTFRHAIASMFKGMKAVAPRLISWPTADERESMRGLINGFPSVICFVDGTKQRAWRPTDDILQEYLFDGHHHFHAYSVLYWCNTFGECIRLDITMKGSQHDRGLYNESEPGKFPRRFFAFDENSRDWLERVMVDTGFQGSGPIVAPFKANQGTHMSHRKERNRDIRKQRMCNEWAIGAVNNKYRLFLGRWAGSADWFPMAYELAVLLGQFCHRFHGTRPVPLSRLMERQNAYIQSGGATW